MAIQLLIAGVDYTAYADLSTVQITANITTLTDTASFTLNIPYTELIGGHPRPKGKQEFKIMNGSAVEFGGVLAGITENVPEGMPYMQYVCQAKDYSDWFNRRVVTNTYTNWELSAIVADVVNIVNASGAGFTANHIYNTGVYVTQKFDHLEPSQLIQSLADTVGFWFYIDYNKDVHFEPILTSQSALPGNALLVDTDTGNYGNLTFAEDVSQLRNQVYLYGYKLPLQSAITENFLGDGVATTFNMTYELIHSLGNIAVQVGGVARVNALDITGGLPPATGTTPVDDGKVYINYVNKTLRFLVAPTAGAAGSCTYQPMIGTASLYNNPASFAVMKARDGLDGIYEWGENNPNLSATSSALANLEGGKLNLKYSMPHYTGAFESFMQGWRSGQYFSLTSAYRMGGEFQNKIFYIIKIVKTIVNHPTGGAPTFFHQISIGDTPYSF